MPVDRSSGETDGF